ncbi:MAG: DinB family protein [Pyrinomonadaceae bacterium]
MTKAILLEQFTACYDKDAWFVALKNTLEAVTADEALWKPQCCDNSIWETVSHLNYYNFAYVERFKGVDYQYPADDNDATFTAGEATAEAWNAETARLDAILTEFRDLIANADESKFNEPVSKTNRASWATLISNINAHNAYHAGQILLLRKLQGSWDRSKGVS